MTSEARTQLLDQLAVNMDTGTPSYATQSAPSSLQLLIKELLLNGATIWGEI